MLEDLERSTHAALVRLVRDEGRRVLATLVRTTGDLGLAEDAVQDAVVRALETWPRDGVPDEPRAWLTVAARRRAIDLVRREAARGPKEVAAMGPIDDGAAPRPDEPAVPGDSVVRDDQLRLVFTCCHPALSLETQVALALRTLCGLDTAQVARALLVPEPTMQKRLARAREKIRKAHIPYRVPPDAELPERVAGVAGTVYLLFNEGYTADGDELVDEAVRLGRLMHELMPDEPAFTGLLALMLLHDARRDSRFDPDGEVVLLADQDRGTWSAHSIQEGVLLVGEGLRRTPDRPDPYVVQAAIAACHALAPAYADTDWAAVVSWYDVLLTVHDTAVVRLNRAAAVAGRDGDAAGLEAVEQVAGLEWYPAWHASRAELARRLGRPEEAAAGYRRALELEPAPARRRHLERRLEECAGGPPGGPVGPVPAP